MIEQPTIKVTLEPAAEKAAHEAAVDTLGSSPRFRASLYKLILDDPTARANAEKILGFSLDESKVREALDAAEKELVASEG